MRDDAIIYISLSVALCLVSFLFDKKKTLAGIKKGWNMFRNMFMPFASVLILMSIVLYLMPPGFIGSYLGAGSGIWGWLTAAVIGAIAFIPGFISYPIAAGLIAEGATYMVTATFMTTLMMVGMISLPLESQYFGRKVAIMRNALNFVAALIIGVLVGVIYDKVF